MLKFDKKNIFIQQFAIDIMIYRRTLKMKESSIRIKERNKQIKLWIAISMMFNTRATKKSLVTIHVYCDGYRNYRFLFGDVAHFIVYRHNETIVFEFQFVFQP